MIDDDDCGDDFGDEMFTRGMESPNEEEGGILQEPSDAIQACLKPC